MVDQAIRETVNIADNSCQKLKIALLGFTQEAYNILKIAESMGIFEICAVSVRDKERAESLAFRYGCEIYDDPRQMILGGKAQLLIVASQHQCPEELITLAFENGMSVLKTLPAFFSLSQAAYIITEAMKNNVFYVSASLHRYYPGYQAIQNYLDNNPEEKKNIYLIEARGKYNVDTNNPDNHWLRDPELAGGGVILRNCHSIFNVLTKLFNLPETIYTIKTNMSQDIVQRNMLTEDCAVCSMRFSEKMMVSVTATRNTCLDFENIRFYFTDKYISVRPNSLKIRSLDDELISEVRGPIDETGAIQKILKLVYDAIMAEDELREENAKVLLKRESELLNTMAVIEAAYLSSKTQSPEMPDKMIDLSGIDLSLLPE